MNAIIFPGQGAQYKGMGQDIFDNYPKAKELLCHIDKVLDVGISRVCFAGTEQELKQTYYQQLAILSVCAVTYELFKEKNIKIDYLSGLSLGEYTCLYAAGVLKLESLLRLVKERALAMQEAAAGSNSGMLAVIGLERTVLEEQARQEGFYPANINSGQQIVVSVERGKMPKVKALLEGMGAKVVELEVSGGFHSPFIAPARARLQKVIDSLTFSDARIPIVSNFTAKAHTDKDEIKKNLIEQLTSPVLWKDCVDCMTAAGVDTMYEIGPSRVLKGLIRKINPAIKVINIEKKADIENISA